MSKKTQQEKHEHRFREIKKSRPGLFTQEDFEFFQKTYLLRGLEYYKLKSAKPHSEKITFKYFEAAADKERSDAYKQIRVENGKLVLDSDKLSVHVAKEISQGRFVSIEEKGNGVHVIVYLKKSSSSYEGHANFEATKVEGKRGTWGEDHARTDNWANVVKCYVDTFKFDLPLNILQQCLGKVPDNLYAQAELMSARSSHHAISHFLLKFQHGTPGERQHIVSQMHLQFFSVGLYFPASPFDSRPTELKRIPLCHCKTILSYWNGKTYSPPPYLPQAEDFVFKIMPSVQFCDKFTENDETTLKLFISECLKRQNVQDDGCEGFIVKSGKNDDISQDSHWKCKWMYKSNQGVLVLPGPNNKLLIFKRPQSDLPEGFFCCPPKEPYRNPNVGHFVAMTQYKLIDDPKRSEELGVTGVGPIKWDALEAFLLFYKKYSKGHVHPTTQGHKDGKMTQIVCSQSATEFFVPLSEVDNSHEYQFLVLDLDFFQQATGCPPMLCYALNQLVHAPGSQEYIFDTNVCYGLHLCEHLLIDDPQSLKECMDNTEPLNFETKCLMKSYVLRINPESEGWNREAVKRATEESCTNPHNGPGYLKPIHLCQVMQTLNNLYRGSNSAKETIPVASIIQKRKIEIAGPVTVGQINPVSADLLQQVKPKINSAPTQIKVDSNYRPPMSIAHLIRQRPTTVSNFTKKQKTTATVLPTMHQQKPTTTVASLTHQSVLQVKPKINSTPVQIKVDADYRAPMSIAHLIRARHTAAGNPRALSTNSTGNPPPTHKRK